MRILLVDDNEFNIEIGGDVLREMGFLVETAGNGLSALEKVVKSSADHYDLILMDEHMPVLDGLEATRMIRQLNDPKKASIPVIAMSANSLQENRKKELAAGMNGYIGKAIDPGLLLQIIDDLAAGTAGEECEASETAVTNDAGDRDMSRYRDDIGVLLRCLNCETGSLKAMTLSLIKPHFTFNVLNDIYYLCKKDPKRARKCTSYFADYLRSNLDSLSSPTKSFDEELEAAENYLKLEMVRFEDKVNVEYDIQAKSFRLPSLLLQSLAENAVRDSIRKSNEPGTVTISTREYDNEYELRVSDTGTGTAEKLLETQRSAAAASNRDIDFLRSRVEELCNGSLEVVTNEAGKGILAIVHVPK